ncbi:MAG: hypothetical protein WCG08_14465, partial [Paludibacter sp.]
DPTIKAMAFEKDGMQTIAILNVSKTLKTIRIKDSIIKTLNGIKEFIYADGMLKKEGDHTLLPNNVNLTMDLQKGYNLKMPGESLFVYTNCNY